MALSRKKAAFATSLRLDVRNQYGIIGNQAAVINVRQRLKSTLGSEGDTGPASGG
jgi:hypothetical protein